MRRLMLLMVALSFVNAITGCQHVFTHGVCDCDQIDHCSSRSPWIRTTGIAPPAEMVPAPAPAKAMPAAPKEL